MVTIRNQTYPELESDYDHDNTNEHYDDESDYDHDDTNEHHDDELHTTERDEATPKEKLAVLSFLMVFVAQMVTDQYGVKTPANILTDISVVFIDAFNMIGGKFVEWSIILSKYVNIKVVASAIYKLFTPFFQLLGSPVNILIGMAEKSFGNFEVSWIAILTSIHIILIVFVMAERNLSGIFRPSIILENFKEIVRSGYGKVGVYFAHVSAIYRVLRLDKFVEDVIAIARPIVELAVTPFESICTYFETVNSAKHFCERKNAIVSGTGVLLAGGLTLSLLYIYGSPIVNFTSAFYFIVDMLTIIVSRSYYLVLALVIMRVTISVLVPCVR